MSGDGWVLWSAQHCPKQAARVAAKSCCSSHPLGRGTDLTPATGTGCSAVVVSKIRARHPPAASHCAGLHVAANALCSPMCASETYYWDTLWIVMGLIACGMHGTAQGIVQNLLDEVSTGDGHGPRSGRRHMSTRHASRTVMRQRAWHVRRVVVGMPSAEGLAFHVSCCDPCRWLLKQAAASTHARRRCLRLRSVRSQVTAFGFVPNGKCRARFTARVSRHRACTCAAPAPCH